MTHKKPLILVILICLFIFLTSGCGFPETVVYPIVTLVPSTAPLAGNITPTPASTATIPRTEAPPAPTPTAIMPVNDLNEETDVVFTIANDEPASGLAGALPPDWLGWGAQALTIGPDGSFWILDTAAAHPSRLLQFSPEGVLLKEIVLEWPVVGAVDAVVTGEKIWVLGAASQPPKIVEYNLDGDLVAEIPLLTSPQPNNLWLSEEGELWVTDPTKPAPYQFLDANGEVAVVHLKGFSYEGHLYRVIPQGFGQPIIISVDDIQFDITASTPKGQVSGADWLGAMKDGLFYVAVWEEQKDLDSAIGPFVGVVHVYAPTGEHLGVTLLPKSAVYVDAHRDLAVGPDRVLYALVSRADHSVDILRLGFIAQLLPLPEATPTPNPTLMAPLLPAWATPTADATDLEIARNTLLNFFISLHDGRFAEAATLYGGPLDAVVVPNPESPPPDPGQFWEEACHLLQCLLVANIVKEEQFAPDEFHFVIEFMWDDGTRFQFGTCCGATEADMPPVWQFPYTVKKIDGQMKVMEPPVYVP